MYHEEKVINGVLCHRGTPDGEWIEYSKEYLTKLVIKYREYASTVAERDHVSQ